MYHENIVSCHWGIMVYHGLSIMGVLWSIVGYYGVLWGLTW